MDASIANKPAAAIPRLVRFKFAVAKRGLWFIGRCSTLNGLYFAAKCFALCEWLVNHKRRARYHNQMRRIFGEEQPARERSAGCRRYFIRTRCDKVFYLIFDLLTAEEITSRIHFPDRARIDDSLQQGRGVYVALAHFGAHHIAGLLMGFLGYETAGVRDPDEAPLRRYIQERLRTRFAQFCPAKVFYADSFPRELYRWFRKNGILGSALDVERKRHPHLKRVPVEVFGDQKEYLTGTMQIALRCQAAIHQGFIISQPGFHYDMYVTEPLIDAADAKDDPEVLHGIMQRYARNLETYIRKYPDHISRI